MLCKQWNAAEEILLILLSEILSRDRLIGFISPIEPDIHIPQHPDGGVFFAPPQTEQPVFLGAGSLGTKTSQFDSSESHVLIAGLFTPSGRMMSGAGKDISSFEGERAS